MDHVPHEIFPFVFNLIFVLCFFLFCPSTSQGPHLKFFCTCFHTLLLPNCFRIKSSTYLVKFPWCYEFATLQIITLAPFTPFTTCWLATPFFQVSHNPLSSNDTGCHTVWILITLNSWLSIPGRCNLISVCPDQIPMDSTKYSTCSHKCILFLLCLTDFNENYNFCDVLSLYNCIL